jgi:hypothetical protein
MVGAVSPQRGADLTSSDRGCMLVPWRRGAQNLHFSLTTPPALSQSTSLKDEFQPWPTRIPVALTLFARISLGDAGWHTPISRAIFTIDGPNLRARQYGSLDYRGLVEGARDRSLHYLHTSPVLSRWRGPCARDLRLSRPPRGVDLRERLLRHERQLQARRLGRTRQIRAFCNVVTIATDQEVPISSITKPGASSAEELARLDGIEVPLRGTSRGLSSAALKDPAGDWRSRSGPPSR